MIDLSIIIVNWNTKDLLIQCLKSFDQTSERLKMEVFVVDNGSVDRSVELVREKFPEVIVIQNPMNLGFAKANNQAMKLDPKGNTSFFSIQILR